MISDIVILAGDSPWTWALANALRHRFGDLPVIVEDKEPAALFIRRRIRRLGLLTVIGQVAFGLDAKAARPLLRRRERNVLTRVSLDRTPISFGLIHVPSANDLQTVEVLKRLHPKVIVVSQTRILARSLLTSIPAIFINVHTGITPRYRGHHGAYWALVNNDASNCGVTVHIVDAGIDTGPTIAQARIMPSPSDNYFTYHWAQLAVGLPLLIQAVEDALSGQLATSQPKMEGASILFSNPTLWGYIWTGLSRGVW